MIHRKENGQLKAKAGLGIIDNILSTLSNNAISNRACALKFGEVDGKIAELAKNEFGTGITVPRDTDYVAPSDGYLTILLASLTNSHVIGCSVNNVNLLRMVAQVPSSTINTIFIRKGMIIKVSGTATVQEAEATFIPLI